MPKMKTHSGSKKRFKKLKNGLIKASSAFHRHLMRKKTAKVKRQQRGGFIVHPADAKSLSKLLQ
jgi:large subunit ribosomal protein L35